MNPKHKAVFIDRDGVVSKLIYRGENHIVGEKICSWTAAYSYGEFEIFPFVSDALCVLSEIGFLRIIITNQPDVAYGLLSQSDYDRMMNDILELSIDDIFVCPHTRYEGCECKKPKPGMLYAAAQKWNIDLARSYMIGDTEKDKYAAEMAGCRFVLISASYNTHIISELRASDFLDAALLIKKIEGGEVNDIC